MNVYPPSEDSELLAEVAVEEVKQEDEVLEVGVGSGYVSAMLQGKCRLVIGTDISPHAVREARSKGIDVIRTDLARGIRKKFSLILFNPPYLELEDFERRGEWIEKAIDGGRKGIEVTSRFIDEIEDNLQNGGRIILIASSINLPYLQKKMSRFSYRIVKRRKLFFEEIFALKLEKRFK